MYRILVLVDMCGILCTITHPFASHSCCSGIHLYILDSLSQFGIKGEARYMLYLSCCCLPPPPPLFFGRA